MKRPRRAAPFIAAADADSLSRARAHTHTRASDNHRRAGGIRVTGIAQASLSSLAHIYNMYISM